MSTSSNAESLPARNGGHGTRLRPMLCGVWFMSLFISASTYTVFNDQFDRVSRARQVARYGELPFRDFFDPGYFMTEFVSGGLQLFLGDNLLGEWLRDTVFIASGVTLVAALMWRVSNSVVLAALAALLSALAFPRGYDFDKVFFYPLGVMLCWRYVESPTAARTWALASGAVIAGLFRYDTAIYITGAAITAMLVVHAPRWNVLARRICLVAMALVCLSLPALIFLQSTSGILDAADQMVTYGRRESANTRVATPLPFSLSQPISVSPLPPLSRSVIVRWSPSLDAAGRRAAEERHTLHNGKRREEPAERTWDYEIADPSPSRLRSLVQDPLVEDTSGIDRERFTLPNDGWWIRAQRAVPLLRLRLFAGSWHADNADAALYHLLHVLPLIAGLALAVTRWGSPVSRPEIAKISSLIAMCVALNFLILRHPVGARIGGMAGPPAILAVWVVGRAWRARGEMPRRLLKAITLVVLAVTIWSISETADWQRRLSLDIASPARLTRFRAELAASPPNPDLLGGREVAGIIRYVRECTRRQDRILATWFVPELYFFSQRPFAAGLATVFAGHWSEPRFQQRSVQLLTLNPAAIIIHQTDDTDFRRDYPLLDRHIHEHYRRSGMTDSQGVQFGGGGLSVFVRDGLIPGSTHAATGLPCFGE